MPNYTKKHPNVTTHPSENHPSTTPTGSDTGNQTLEELQEENRQLQRRLQKYKGAAFFLFWKKLTLKNIEKHNSTQSKIKPLTQPKGEAGNHKRGFILYSAMGMEDVENGAVVYDRMRVRDCFFANVFLTRLSGFGS